MLKKVMFAVVLTLSSLALAQKQTQRQSFTEASSPDATKTCDVTFASGTGFSGTKFCVTVNGNIAQFSVAGLEMIANGYTLEGYGLCDATANVAYYDWADFDSGNWASPSFTHNGNVVTVTRLTSDNNWKLTQTITNVPATATGPGSAKVSMALKNLSGVSREAYLLRFADVNAEGDLSGNDFDYTGQTAYALEPGDDNSGRGLSSTNNTFKPDYDQTAFAQNTDNPPSPCNAFANTAPHPFHGDGSIVQFWGFRANPNATETVVSTYKPI